MTSMGLKSCGGSSAVLAASFLRLFMTVFVGLQREILIIGSTPKPDLGYVRGTRSGYRSGY